MAINSTTGNTLLTSGLLPWHSDAVGAVHPNSNAPGRVEN
jgi:hypothetical protein